MNDSRRSHARPLPCPLNGHLEIAQMRRMDIKSAPNQSDASRKYSYHKLPPHHHYAMKCHAVHISCLRNNVVQWQTCGTSQVSLLF